MNKLYARARVSLVSWEGRSHALLFMVPLGLPSARPMAQALWLPFEYYKSLIWRSETINTSEIFSIVGERKQPHLYKSLP